MIRECSVLLHERSWKDNGKKFSAVSLHEQINITNTQKDIKDSLSSILTISSYKQLFT
jgi:hypothetical protein